MKRARISVSTLAIAALIGVGFVAAPVGFDDQLTPEMKSAFAKGAGKSSGKGGGKKGGSKSKSSKAGGSDSDTLNGDEEAGDKAGNGHIKAKGNGHAKNHDGEGDPNENGKLSSSLGNLNAAHASDTALQNASKNSMVGMLALYAAQVRADVDPLSTLAEQQDALGEFSNKPVDEEVVNEVNRLLGLNEEAESVVNP